LAGMGINELVRLDVRVVASLQVSGSGVTAWWVVAAFVKLSGL